MRDQRAVADKPGRQKFFMTMQHTYLGPHDSDCYLADTTALNVIAVHLVHQTLAKHL